MRTRSCVRRLGDRRGQTVVEFALASVLLVMLILGLFEIVRMLLVYTSVASASRIGVRYAIVHGADSSVTTAQIQTEVKAYLSAPMNTSSATITVNYPDAGCPTVGCTSPGTSGCTMPGCHVTVSVSYTYDQWITYFKIPAISVTSTTVGVITF